MKPDTHARLIPTSADFIRATLLRPLELPAWNPAFVDLTGPNEPIVGEAYGLTGIRGLRGAFRYTAIEPFRVDMAWDVPGMREECSWTLDPDGRGNTLVTHEVSRSGPLAIALRPAFAGLARLRLDRLDQLARAA